MHAVHAIKRGVVIHMSMQRYMRQSDLVDERIFDTSVTIIGAGSIGSFTTLALAKCGFKRLTVWDDDSLEEHNFPNQMYPVGDFGAPKVLALARVISDFVACDIETTARRYTNDSSLVAGVLVMAVDSMEARRVIYRRNKSNPECKAIIDARMGGQQLEVYTVRPDIVADRKYYQKKLYSDEEASPLPCTQRAVIYTVLTAASFICNQIRLVLEERMYARELILDFENMILLTTPDPLKVEPKVSNRNE